MRHPVPENLGATVTGYIPVPYNPILHFPVLFCDERPWYLEKNFKKIERSEKKNQ